MLYGSSCGHFREMQASAVRILPAAGLSPYMSLSASVPGRLLEKLALIHLKTCALAYRSQVHRSGGRRFLTSRGLSQMLAFPRN